MHFKNFKHSVRVRVCVHPPLFSTFLKAEVYSTHTWVWQQLGLTVTDNNNNGKWEKFSHPNHFKWFMNLLKKKIQTFSYKKGRGKSWQGSRSCCVCRWVILLPVKKWLMIVATITMTVTEVIIAMEMITAAKVMSGQCWKQFCYW